MKLECPYGWKWLSQIGNVRLESKTVNICEGICDSCDLCRIKSCEFYDLSAEATRQFLRAQAEEEKLEWLLQPLN